MGNLKKEMSENAISFWLNKKGEYGRLYELALQMLSISATSAPSERFSSIAGVSASGKKTNVKPELVEFEHCVRTAVSVSMDIDLLELVLEEYFGVCTSTVAGVLMRHGRLPLQAIAFQTKLPLKQIRSALCVLIEHQLVSVDSASGRKLLYRCNPGDVLNLVRLPRCILVAKTLYGEKAESLVEELGCQGQLTLSDCLRRVCDRLETAKETLKQDFSRLAAAHFVKRCPQLAPNNDDMDLIPAFSPLVDPFLLPDNILTSRPSEANRKRKQNDDADIEILWRINYDKFWLYFRDDLIIEMVRRLSDDTCGQVLRAMLQLNELKSDPKAAVSYLLSANELWRSISDSVDINISRQQMETSITFLTDLNINFLRRSGDSSGGIYVIDFGCATEALCQYTMESIVREKFGTKGLRVFRLLISKKYLEQSSIENLAMLPNKEGKELVYQLLGAQYVFVKEVSRSGDFAPTRTFYLFYVDLPAIARAQLSHTYKALRNVILRRQHESKENRALLDRQEKVEAIVANIQADENLDDATKSQQVAEVEEAYLSPAEKQSLEKYREGILKLQKAEMQLERTTFILECYLNYNLRK